MTQVFSCEYWENFRNTSFEKHVRTAVSEEYSLSKLEIEAFKLYLRNFQHVYYRVVLESFCITIFKNTDFYRFWKLQISVWRWNVLFMNYLYLSFLFFSWAGKSIGIFLPKKDLWNISAYFFEFFQQSDLFWRQKIGTLVQRVVRGVFITPSKIYDGDFFSKIVNG